MQLKLNQTGEKVAWRSYARVLCYLQ